MGRVRIFQPGSYQSHETVTLSEEAFVHMVRVLRLKSGDNFIIFNGCGQSFNAALERVMKKSCTARILDAIVENKESPCHLHLMQAMVKGEKMDYIIQKAVELGVKEITPLFSFNISVRYTEDRLRKKMRHWQEIANHATEQCGRNYCPQIHSPQCFENERIQLTTNHTIICLHPEAKKTLNDLYDMKLDKGPIIIMVGPEGGFTKKEIESINECNGHVIRLGARVLRTETASVVALSALQFLWGDLAF